jgi:chromosome partitioning protein
MKRCSVCEKKMWLSLKRTFGMCNACYKFFRENVSIAQQQVEVSTQIVDTSLNPMVRLEHCRVIIEKAEKYLTYEKEGAPTLEPLPSKLKNRFIARYDEIAANLAELNMNEAFDKAEKALAPLGGIFAVQEVIEKIGAVRDHLHRFPKPPVIVAIINQKGGVGKTTCAINIGDGLSRMGKKVLLVDFDPQANLTEGLGIREQDFQHSIYDIMTGKADWRITVFARGNMSVFPSNVLLARVERDFAGNGTDVFTLRNALRGLREYDFVLIDCLPSLGMLTMNALAAAKEVFVPIQPEYFALTGMNKINDVIRYINQQYSKNIKITGIICTLWNKRRKLSEEIISHIRERDGGKLFESFIRENAALAEAASFGKTIFEYQPKSIGAKDYMNLSKEILQRLEGPAGE